MRPIKIGILCEATCDAAVIEILLRRIIEQENIEVVPEFTVYSTRTGIIGFIRAYLKLFFENPDGNVDFAVFVTDRDNNRESIRNRIKTIISTYNAAYVDVTAVGVPEPHIENWLLVDQDLIKALFKIPPENPIPTKGSPKETLLTLIGEQRGPGTKSQSDIYKEIAGTASTIVMRRISQPFRLFASDFIAKLRAILA